jgi:hypothetical protein
MLTAGCGSQISEAPAVADGTQVDMCTILSDRELAELGITLGSRTPFDEEGVAGCYWLGTPFALSLDGTTTPSPRTSLAAAIRRSSASRATRSTAGPGLNSCWTGTARSARS